MKAEYSIDQHWFKSSYSNAGGSCVEVCATTRSMLVRDSKDRRPDQPIIEFSQPTWQGFVHALKAKSS
jgi:hypothetical protein